MKIKQTILEKLYIVLTCYDDKKYWKFAKYMRDPRISIIAKYYYLYRLKRMEVKNCASLGFRINGGPRFVSPPRLPHGIKGIYLAPDVVIGENVIIYQQVTIGQKNPDDTGAPHIGNNVLIGAGAKILGNIHIGNNVRIGANCVVTKNVPDECIVIGNPMVIIKCKGEYMK